MHTQTITFDTLDQMMRIFGGFDEHVKFLERECSVIIQTKDEGAEIRGDAENVAIAYETLDVLKSMYEKKEAITIGTVGYALELVRDGQGDIAKESMADVVAFSARGVPIKCRTFGQKGYIKAIKENTVTLCIGPAGTGKTYLAMAMAVTALKNKEVSRIILTRPAVEAGEKLGFLPGDLQNKVDPYLRPLYDALYDMIGVEAYNRYAEQGVIEVAPLAYMRGRTINNSWIVLDEGQNASLEQLKMFLTRFGEGSKVVVTGDVTQIDLPKERPSGLKQATEILKGIEDIGVVQLTNKDVVRHKLVKNILKAFDKFEEGKQRKPRK
ncbi:PhoH family protein [Eubacteriales bacterium OttesenSCG-928-M02]|nr:PhoH family protein [Eubacteriales bacterium OttesenSCG-928-M02]